MDVRCDCLKFAQRKPKGRPTPSNDKAGPVFDIQIVRRGISSKVLKRRAQMSITRRQFLISSTSAGVGLILPSYYEKVFSFFENHGEPLLEVPTRVSEDLYADFTEFDYQLNLGLPTTEFPEMTWREVIERYYEWTPDPDNLERELDITIADLDKPAYEDAYLDHWCRVDSPNARAFRLLDNLDIGTELQHGDQVGGLIFYDGPMPGSDYLGVHAECAVSLSLLQHRLNELNTGIRVLTP
jgi:hypothetical protein